MSQSPSILHIKVRAILAGISALLLTVGLARFAYTPLLPIMHEQADLSLLTGGWLATFNYMGYMSGALLAATTSSLTRKFLYYRIGLVMGLLSTAAMGLTTDPITWAVLRYLAGLSGASGMLLASGLIMNWLLRHQQRTELGLHFSGLGLGVVLSGIAVGALSEIPLGWDAQWLALGAIGLLLFVPAWVWMPRPAPISQTAQDAAGEPPSRTWMTTLITAYFCAGFGFAISATFIVSILVELPLLADHGGWVWVLVGLAAAPSAFLWDRIARRQGMNWALSLAFGLHVLASALPLLTQQPMLGLLSGALFGGTFVGIVSLTLTLVGRRFPANPSKAMAKLTLSYGLAQILAPAMAGQIADATGSYLASLLVATVLMLAGLGLMFMLRRLEARLPISRTGESG